MKKSDLKKIIREVIAEAMSGPTKGPMSGMKGKKPMMSTRDGNTGRGDTSKLGGGKHYRHPSKGPGHNPNIDGGDNTDLAAFKVYVSKNGGFGFGTVGI